MFSSCAKQTAIRRGVVATIMFTLGWAVPVSAQSSDTITRAPTAKLVLGPQAGEAKPSQRGAAYIGGGNIEIAQPKPDTIVITMGGTVAAASSLVTCGEALLNFCHVQQFAVQFSDPAATGKLFMQAKVNGLLRAAGARASVGMNHAISSIFAGPNEIASIPIAPKAAGGCDSSAISASHGPVCVPVTAGCYTVRQQFSIFAAQSKGWGCHKASAQFAPGSLGPTWIATRDPFQSADASNLGFELVLRVVPDGVRSSAVANGDSMQFFPAP